MTRSRGSSLPRDRWRSRMRGGPPCGGLGAARLQLVGKRAHARGVGGKLRRARVDIGCDRQAIPSRAQLYAHRKSNVNGSSGWNRNESSEIRGTEYGVPTLPPRPKNSAARGHQRRRWNEEIASGDGCSRRSHRRHRNGCSGRRQGTAGRQAAVRPRCTRAPRQRVEPNSRAMRRPPAPARTR